MDQMAEQARSVDADLVDDMITEIDLSAQPITAKGDSGNTYSGDAVIIATGAQARWLGLPSEDKFKASASRHAPRVTDSSSAVWRSLSSAVATQPWKRRST